MFCTMHGNMLTSSSMSKIFGAHLLSKLLLLCSQCHVFVSEARHSVACRCVSSFRSKLLVGDGITLRVGKSCNDVAILSIHWGEVFHEDFEQKLQDNRSFPRATGTDDQSCSLRALVHGNIVALVFPGDVKSCAEPFGHGTLFFG